MLDALTFMAQGKSNAEIKTFLPDVPLATIKRWRADKFAKTVGKAVTKKESKAAAQAAKEVEDATDEALVEQGILPAPPDDDTFKRTRMEEIGIADFQLGLAVRRTLAARMSALERILIVVSEPSYVKLQGAGDVAKLIEQIDTGAIRLVEAAQRRKEPEKPPEGGSSAT